MKDAITQNPVGVADLIREEEAGLLGELDVLQHLCHAFPSTAGYDEAYPAIVRWVRAALAYPGAGIRLLLLGDDGALQSAVEDAWPPVSVDRRRPQQAFEDKRPVFTSSRSHPHLSFASLPLVCRGESVGVLELALPVGHFERRRRTVEAVVSQSATILRNLRDRERLQQKIDSLQTARSLLHRLPAATSVEEAAQVAVKYSGVRFGVPLAAWVLNEQGTGLSLVASDALGPSKENLLRVRMRELERSELPTGDEPVDSITKFAAIVGIDHAIAITAGEALVLMGVPAEGREAFDEFVRLLESVLWNLSTVSKARKRNEQLDLAIACTAHELRGPLLAAKAAIDVVLAGGGPGTMDPELLRMSQRELQLSAELVEAVLSWSAGHGPLNRRTADLMTIVRQAVDSCSLEASDARVDISGPHEVLVQADPHHLHGAIANLVRNALWYSPLHTRVEIEVATSKTRATVSVTDYGPGIPAEEREAIFDPFVRGAAKHAARGGKGLGLFIARRVTDAHEGSIWVESSESSTTFRMHLPLTP